MNPDCRDGKHSSCNGVGYDETLDLLRPCPCICHDPSHDHVHAALDDQFLGWGTRG